MLADASQIAVANGIPPANVFDREILAAILGRIEAHHGFELLLRDFRRRDQERVDADVYFDAGALVYRIIKFRGDAHHVASRERKTGAEEKTGKEARRIHCCIETGAPLCSLLRCAASMNCMTSSVSAFETGGCFVFINFTISRTRGR